MWWCYSHIRVVSGGACVTHDIIDMLGKWSMSNGRITEYVGSIHCTVPDTASYIRGWMQMVLTPNDLFSWNNKYSKYTIILSHIHTIQRIHSPSSSHARHLLCACWHSEVVKGSSSLSSRRLLISLWVTSSLSLCPELTDAPCPYYGGPVPPFPKWRPHSQGPHTLPFQGTRHVHMGKWGRCT
jgi:hypothetical protein